MATTRRSFVRSSVIGSLGIMIGGTTRSAKASEFQAPDFAGLSENLREAWCDALLRLQQTDRESPELLGGIFCPARRLIHGRCGDSVYPLIHMAFKTGQDRYLVAVARAVRNLTWD